MLFNCSFERMKYKYFYVVTIQFLGFRFHGWQKQTNAKTLHEMVDKSLEFVFHHTNFKTLGASRTDAKVSANRYVFELFINGKCLAIVIEADFLIVEPNRRKINVSCV